MGAFNPVPAPKLIDHLQPDAVGVDVRSIITDLAEAGLIRGYARLILKDGAAADGEARDAKIDRTVWQRINRQDAADRVWSTGTVRLNDSDGSPGLSVIGIRFDEAAVRGALVQHGFPLRKPRVGPSASKTSTPADPPEPTRCVQLPPAALATPTPSLDEAATFSVNEAARTLRVGKTTLYARIKDGTLVAKKIGTRTVITTESIRRLLN